VSSEPTSIEERERADAERRGDPFLIYRGPDGRQRILALGEGDGRLTIGRGNECALWIDWDKSVSSLHAALECVGAVWTLVDDGLSRNGSFVNGQRVHGRRRLHDGDLIELGRTQVAFRAPREERVSATMVGIPRPDLPEHGGGPGAA
jgi:predicted component of type VI protein secretion system